MADEIDDAAETAETELLAALQHHDPRAFERFFETHVDRVYRIAVGIVGNDADAQELVQATFLSAFEALDRFEPHARLSTWLYRITHNHALMLARRQSRHPSEPLPEDDGEGLRRPCPPRWWTGARCRRAGCSAWRRKTRSGQPSRSCRQGYGQHLCYETSRGSRRRSARRCRASATRRARYDFIGRGWRYVTG